MALYVAESHYHTVLHGKHDSAGVVGQGGGKEKIYLHVVPLTDAEIGRLGPRVDDNGNKEHDRLALPDQEDWWIAIDGEKLWPGTLNPKVRSKCSYDGSTAARPTPLTDAEIAELRRVNAKLPAF